jgi:hypothetical protein
VAKSSSIFGIWLLELVPYTVELVLKAYKLGTGACTCSDAKFHNENKITYLANSQSFRFQPLVSALEQLGLLQMQGEHTSAW